MTKFKINTATSKAAVANITIMEAIMHRTGITYNEWVLCLFETGCRFIERNIEDEFTRRRLLQQQCFGFWDWWLVIFITDDESLLQFHSVNSLTIYELEKQRLLSLMDTNTQFRYFLKSNSML